MLEEALEHLVKGIVDHPEDVTVDLLTNRRGKTLEIRVHPDDLGKVIGRGGGPGPGLRRVVYGVGGRGRPRDVGGRQDRRRAQPHQEELLEGDGAIDVQQRDEVRPAQHDVRR